MDLRDGRIHQALIPSATVMTDDEAALAILDQQAPPIAPLWRVLWGELFVLLCTKEQNSSISSPLPLRFCRVQTLQLLASILRSEAPIHRRSSFVALLLPGTTLLSKRLLVRDAPR